MSPDDYNWHFTERHFSAKMAKFPALPKAGAVPKELPPLPPGADGGGGGGGGGSMEFIIKWPGPLQEIVDLQQINNLHDNDQASVGPLELELQPIDPAPVLDPMLEDAQNAVPVKFEPEHNDSSSVLEFVNNRDSHPAETQTGDAPYTVAAGKYVNDELQDPDTDVHQITNDKIDAISAALEALDGPPALPSGDHSGMHIQEMSLPVPAVGPRVHEQKPGHADHALGRRRWRNHRPRLPGHDTAFHIDAGRRRDRGEIGCAGAQRGRQGFAERL
jgi:hypothetical protein